MKLPFNEYADAVSEYKNTWRVLDDTLYALCRDHPDHTSWGSICAKLWIIGRTYATGIERKVATRGTQGSSMTQVAELLHKQGKKIDKLIDELSDICEPLTPPKLQSIVSVHGRFMNLLMPITRRNQCPRSFVSKYLHFHNPVVPIYDSFAARILPSIVRWTNDLMAFDMLKDGDNTYGWYAMRFFRLYEGIRVAGLPAKVKHVDYYLLSMAGVGTAPPSKRMVVA